MKVSVTAIVLSFALLFMVPGGAHAVPAGWVDHEASVYQVRVTIPAKTKKDHEGHGSGTAWYIGYGYFLTCAHVVQDIKNKVVLHKDDKDLKVTIVWSKPEFDVALLKVDDLNDVKDVPALKMSQDIPGIGTEVEAIGYPGGIGPFHLFGKIAAKPHKDTRDEDDEDDESEKHHELLAADMATIAGESGGPVFNEKGEVIGIAEATWPVAPPIQAFLPKELAAKVPHTPQYGPIGFIIPSRVYQDALPSEFTVPCVGVTHCK